MADFRVLVEELVAQEDFWNIFEFPFVEMELCGIEVPDCSNEVELGENEEGWRIFRLLSGASVALLRSSSFALKLGMIDGERM